MLVCAAMTTLDQDRGYAFVIAVQEKSDRTFLIDTVVLWNPTEADIRNVIDYCHERLYSVVMTRCNVGRDAMNAVMSSVDNDASGVPFAHVRRSLLDGVDMLLAEGPALPDDGYGERQ